MAIQSRPPTVTELIMGPKVTSGIVALGSLLQRPAIRDELSAGLRMRDELSAGLRMRDELSATTKMFESIGAVSSISRMFEPISALSSVSLLINPLGKPLNAGLAFDLLLASRTILDGYGVKSISDILARSDVVCGRRGRDGPHRGA